VEVPVVVGGVAVSAALADDAGPRALGVRVTLDVIRTLKVTRILGALIEGRLNPDIRG
jgi:hypothetical protein